MTESNKPKTVFEALDRELHLMTWLLAVPVAVVSGFLGRFVTPIGIGIM